MVVQNCLRSALQAAGDTADAASQPGRAPNEFELVDGRQELRPSKQQLRRKLHLSFSSSTTSSSQSPGERNVAGKDPRPSPGRS